MLRLSTTEIDNDKARLIKIVIEYMIYGRSLTLLCILLKAFHFSHANTCEIPIFTARVFANIVCLVRRFLNSFIYIWHTWYMYVKDTQKYTTFSLRCVRRMQTMTTWSAHTCSSIKRLHNTHYVANCTNNQIRAS